MGFSRDNLKGFILALLSSAFIGASFIIKKKGLRRAAAASGVRAGKNLYLLFVLYSQSYNVFSIWVLIFVRDRCHLLEFIRCWGLLISPGASMVAWNDNQ